MFFTLILFLLSCNYNSKKEINYECKCNKSVYINFNGIIYLDEHIKVYFDKINKIDYSLINVNKNQYLFLKSEGEIYSYCNESFELVCCCNKRIKVEISSKINNLSQIDTSFVLENDNNYNIYIRESFGGKRRVIVKKFSAR
jgi:hypothetical protein